MSATHTLSSAQHCPPGGVIKYDSQGGANSGVVSASPASILRAVATNGGGSTLYIMLFDATSLPANASLPIVAPVPVAAGSTVVMDWTIEPGAGVLFGRSCATGVVWAASTTATSLTVDATASLWITIDYATGST
jgi:hypothetical protein